MKTLWPYYSTKKKAFYRDGKKRMVIERESKGVYKISGNPIPNKTIMWLVGKINLSELKLLKNENNTRH